MIKLYTLFLDSVTFLLLLLRLLLKRKEKKRKEKKRKEKKKKKKKKKKHVARTNLSLFRASLARHASPPPPAATVGRHRSTFRHRIPSIRCIMAKQWRPRWHRHHDKQCEQTDRSQHPMLKLRLPPLSARGFGQCISYCYFNNYPSNYPFPCGIAILLHTMVGAPCDTCGPYCGNPFITEGSCWKLKTHVARIVGILS